ncbi:hypothetical protein Dimus_001719 [Dionaea muscipula]
MCMTTSGGELSSGDDIERLILRSGFGLSAWTRLTAALRELCAGGLDGFVAVGGDHVWTIAEGVPDGSGGCWDDSYWLLAVAAVSVVWAADEDVPRGDLDWAIAEDRIIQQSLKKISAYKVNYQSRRRYNLVLVHPVYELLICLFVFCISWISFCTNSENVVRKLIQIVCNDDI